MKKTSSELQFEPVIPGLYSFTTASVLRGDSNPYQELKHEIKFAPSDNADQKHSLLRNQNEIQFSSLQAAQKKYYQSHGQLRLPLSGSLFPIKDVSLTISEKSVLDQQLDALSAVENLIQYEVRVVPELPEEPEDKNNRLEDKVIYIKKEKGGLVYCVKNLKDEKSHYGKKISQKEFDASDLSDDAETLKIELEKRLEEILEITTKAGHTLRKMDNDQESRHANTKSQNDDKELDQKEKAAVSKTRTEFWSSRSRLEEEWYRINTSIKINDVFTISATEQHYANRVLVEGRAGVGKTTFSQYIAYQWATSDLFHSAFHYVFWIPLRQWLQMDLPVGTRPGMQAHLATFVYHHQFNKELQHQVHIEDIEMVLSAGANEHTLLILDGYDEVAALCTETKGLKSNTLTEILKEALEFPHVMVTTRDYQIPPNDIQFDRRLVNIGFTDAQILLYIRSYENWLGEQESQFDTESKTKTSLPLEKILSENLRFWGLAHVPLNLALICETLTQEDIAEKIKKLKKWTLSNLVSLYKAVIICFLDRYLEKHRSKVYGDFDNLYDHCPLEMQILTAIAWNGFKKGNVIISPKILTDLLKELQTQYNKIPKNQIEKIFIDTLNMGFLRSETNDLKSNEQTHALEKHYYFMHLTFQEFFAAYAVLDSLQGKADHEQYEQTIKWLQHHKYELRVCVFLEYLAGLTIQPGYDQALQAFWFALLSPPQDVIGSGHLKLITRCLNEASCDDRIPVKKELLAQLQQWTVDMVYYQSCYKDKPDVMSWFWRLLGQNIQTVIQGDLLKNWDDLVFDFQWQKSVIKALQMIGPGLIKYRKGMSILINAANLCYEYYGFNYESHIESITALGGLGSKILNSPEAKAVLYEALWCDDTLVKKTALSSFMLALGPEFSHHSDLLKELLAYLKGLIEDPISLDHKNHGLAVPTSIKKDGFFILFEQTLKMQNSLGDYPQSLQVVYRAMKSKKLIVTKAIIFLLGTLKEGLLIHRQALDFLLLIIEESIDLELKKIAWDVLCNLGSVVRNDQQACSLVVRQARTLENQDLKNYAMKAVCNVQSETLIKTPEVLSLILLETQNSLEEERQKRALRAISQMNFALDSQALAAILNMSKHEDVNVRIALIRMLANLRLALSREGILNVLLHALKDPLQNVRNEAKLAIKQLGADFEISEVGVVILFEEAINQHLTQHRSLQALFKKLANAKDISNVMTKALLTVLKKISSDDRFFIDYLIEYLSKMYSHPGILDQILMAADNKIDRVRNVAQILFKNMGKDLLLYSEALMKVFKGAEDKENSVKEIALSTLCYLNKELYPKYYNEILVIFIDAFETCDKKINLQILENLTTMFDLLPNYLQSFTVISRGLESKNLQMNRMALSAIGKASEEIPKYPLLVRLLFLFCVHKDSILCQLSQNILQGIKKYFTDDSKELLTVIKESIISSEPDIREGVKYFLINVCPNWVSHSALLPNIIAAAKNQNFSIKKIALEILISMGAQVMDHQEVWALILQAEQSNMLDLRRIALKSMAMIGDRLMDSKEAIEILSKANSSLAVEIQMSAEEIFSKMNMSLLIKSDMFPQILGVRFKEENSNHFLTRLLTYLAEHHESLSYFFKVLEKQDMGIKTMWWTRLRRLGMFLKPQNESVKRIIDALADDNEALREMSLTILGGMSRECLDQSFTEAVLSRAIQDKSSRIKMAAIYTLGSLMNSDFTMPDVIRKHLFDCLELKDENVKIAAIKTISRLDNPFAHQGLIDLLVKMGQSQSGRYKLQKAAIKSLGVLGPKLQEYPQVINAILSAAESGYWEVRLAAVFSLKSFLTAPKALEALLKLAKDDVYIIRQTAIRVFKTSSSFLANNPAVLEILIKTIRNDQHFNDQIAALEVIMLMGHTLILHPEAFSVVAEAAAKWENHIPNPALPALMSVGNDLLQYPQSLAAVIQLASSVQNPILQISAVKVLCHLGQPGIVRNDIQEVFLSLIQTHKKLRMQIIDTLRFLVPELKAHPTAIRILVDIVEDVDGIHDRAAAIQLLGTLEAELILQREAFDAILRVKNWKKEYYIVVLQAAINVLTTMENQLRSHPKAFMRAIDMIKEHKDPDTKNYLIEMFCHLKEPVLFNLDIQSALLEVMDQQSSSIKKLVVDTFFQLEAELEKYPLVIQTLARIAGDSKNIDDRAAAIQLLGKLRSRLVLNKAAFAAVLSVSGENRYYYVVLDAQKAVLNKLEMDMAEQPQNPEVMVTLIKESKSEKIKITLLNILSKLGYELCKYPEALAVIVNAVKDKEGIEERVAAIKALSALEHLLVFQEEALSEILNILQLTHYYIVVKKAAIKTWTQLKSSLSSHPQALSKVIALASDSKIGKFMIEALEQLSPALFDHWDSLMIIIKNATRDLKLKQILLNLSPQLPPIPRQ